MKRAVLLSAHYLESRRKAGFHWLADALQRRGWHVTFATIGFGPQSYLRGDFRCAQIPPSERNRLVSKGGARESFVWYTAFFPVNLKSRLLNWISYPFFALFGHLPLGQLAGSIRRADLIIFESNPSLFLARRVRLLNPRARLVYRVSDDLRMLNSHPVVLAAERNALPVFNLISVVAKAMEERVPGSVWHSHGVAKKLFDTATVSPYPAGSRNAVFVGTFDLDETPVHSLARTFPDWFFHIIGPVKRSRESANVQYHGEMAYTDTVAYIYHADVGLATRLASPDVWLYSDSLKMLQYTYARLPIIAPDGTRNHFGNVFTYRADEEASLVAAMNAAMTFDRGVVQTEAISSWDELAAILAGD